MFCCRPRTHVSVIKCSNEQKSKKTALIIFDWDDTLFATSALKFLLRKYMITHKINLVDSSMEINNLSNIISEYTYLMPSIFEEYKDDFILLSETIKNTMISALKLGFVVIVTNASLGWLKMLCDTFLPNLYEWFIHHNIQVHSAADEYKTTFPNSSHQWKELCFSNIIQKNKSKSFTQIISIGDSDIERKATILVANKHDLLYKILKIPVYTNLRIVQQQCNAFETAVETLYLFKNSIDFQLTLN